MGKGVGLTGGVHSFQRVQNTSINIYRLIILLAHLPFCLGGEKKTALWAFCIMIASVLDVKLRKMCKGWQPW